MFESLSNETLHAAHDAARLLYGNHQALMLDPQAIKLDTLAVDICVEMENRGDPITPTTREPIPVWLAPPRHPTVVGPQVALQVTGHQEV